MSRELSNYISRGYARRRAGNRLIMILLVLGTVITVVPLFLIFWYVVAQGVSALDLGFLTQLPKPVGEAGGGMANALVGTVILIALASMVGVPWGMATGIYLSEYGSTTRGRLATKFVGAVRFSADMLSSIPSILVGLFAYAVIVVAMGRFSALAGGFSLGLIMIPTVARTTEELLKMVPQHIREAGLALGLARWKVILRIVVKGRLGAIITGIMLAVARVAGETAPLLFTAFNNRFWPARLDQPTASLPVQIYTYAISPYEDWHRQAWAGALVLMLLVFFMNLISKLVLSRRDSSRVE